MIIIRIKKLRFVLIALAVSMIQQCLMHRFSYGYIGFDLIILLAAFIAITATVRGALWGGLFLGMVRDLGSIGRMGASALSVLPAVILVWALKERFYRCTMLSDVTFAFLFLAGFGLVYACGMFLVGLPNAHYGYFYHAAGHAAFSTLPALPFFALLRFAGIVEEHKTTF